jgi:hypothetical protein
MEHFVSVLNNEEKLLERVEELYEDDVELKSRNDPTLSRSFCAKRFWSALRRVLPDATVKKLSNTMNQRRYMREQCLREALEMLQENEDEPPLKQCVRSGLTVIAFPIRGKSYLSDETDEA